MAPTDQLFYRGNPTRPLCPVCRLFTEICLCSRLPRLTNRNRISLFLHIKEQDKLTNSGHFLPLCLTNSALVLHGEPGRPAPIENLFNPAYFNCILHPAASRPINEIPAGSSPVNLIIPDGSWRQSNRMLRSAGNLLDLPRFSLPGGFTSAYQLRKESVAGHLSTFEAAALALDLLGEDEISRELLAFFTLFVTTLLNRAGRLSACPQPSKPNGDENGSA